MKKLYLGLLSIFLPYGCAAELANQPAELIIGKVVAQGPQMDSPDFVTLVLQRYYFIQRLKKTISVLSLFQKKLTQNKYPDILKNHFFLAPEELLFGNLAVERSAVAIQEKKNLKPLFDVWEDFSRYKYLQDDLFVEDFTREIFIISRNILLSGTDGKNNMPLRSIKYLSLSPVQFCDVIDLLIDRVVSVRIAHDQSFSANTFDFESVSKELESAEPMINIQYVITRFYLVKRLEKVFAIMNRVNRCIPCAISYTINAQKDLVLENNMVITDKHIKGAVLAMKRTQCWHPFLRLLKDIKSYKFVHNDARVRQLMSLLFIMTRKLLVDLPAKGALQRHRRASTLEAVNMLYQNVDQAAVSDLLDGIDVIMHEIPALLEKFEFNSDMSWQVWLKKYWWLPPTVIGSLGLKIYVQSMMRKNIFTGDPLKTDANTPDKDADENQQGQNRQENQQKQPLGQRNSTNLKPKAKPKNKPNQQPVPLHKSGSRVVSEQEVDQMINDLTNEAPVAPLHKRGSGFFKTHKLPTQLGKKVSKEDAEFLEGLKNFQDDSRKNNPNL